MLFLVDAMLGNVAKKLRLLGYDSEYFSDIDDFKLLQKALDENRIIISKDQNLIKRAEKNGMPSIHITKSDEIGQFIEIHQKTKLRLNKISGDSARCTKCNSSTSLINKSVIANKIPQKILEFHDTFWKCDRCNQIYWEGTHVENLQNFVNEIKSKL